MNSLIESLKTLDFKQLGVRHGEKLGIAVVALLIIMILQATRWQAYPKKPDEMNELVDQAEEAIKTSKWQPEQQSKIRKVNFVDRAKSMVKPLVTEDYKYEVAMMFRLYTTQAPFREPQWLPVEDLIVDGGVAVIALPRLDRYPRRPQRLQDLPVRETDQDFTPRTPGRGMQIQRGGASLPGIDATLIATLGRGAATGGARLGGASGYGAVTQGRGNRYAAIRGIVPLRDQIEKVRMASNLETLRNAAPYVEYKDFKIERQQAIPGPNPWKEENWEPLKMEDTLEFLSEVEAFDIDLVSPKVTDHVFTMPLPKRLTGIWGSRATHPQLEDFLLSHEEVEALQKLQEKMMDAYSKRKDAAKQRFGPQREGFSSVTEDLRRIRAELDAENPSQLDKMLELVSPGSADKLRKRLFNVGAGAGAGMMPGMLPGMGAMGRGRSNMPFIGRGTSRKAVYILASGRLLLFRYLDFTVKPGEVYRYRVKLVLENPNRNRRREDVNDDLVIEGETRETPWSAPSSPVMIKDDVEMFLTDVRRSPKPGIDEDSAKFDVFQWDPEVGTVINAELTCKYGQYIGGKAKGPRLNVASPSLEITDLQFSSRETLVDSFPAPRLRLRDHPALKDALEESTTKGARIVNISIPAEAVVVDEFGKMKMMDTASMRKPRQEAVHRLNDERGPWKFLEDAAGRAGQLGLPPGAASGTLANAQKDQKALRATNRLRIRRQYKRGKGTGRK